MQKHLGIRGRAQRLGQLADGADSGRPGNRRTGQRAHSHQGRPGNCNHRSPTERRHAQKRVRLRAGTVQSGRQQLQRQNRARYSRPKRIGQDIEGIIGDQRERQDQPHRPDRTAARATRSTHNQRVESPRKWPHGVATDERPQIEDTAGAIRRSGHVQDSHHQPQNWIIRGQVGKRGLGRRGGSVRRTSGGHSRGDLQGQHY